MKKKIPGPESVNPEITSLKPPDPDVLKKVLPTLYVDSPKYKALLQLSHKLNMVKEN